MRQPPARRVTIHDVAKAANVSPATVSLVLHEKGQLPQLTRERVLEAAGAVGYRRRLNGRASKTRRNTYGLIVDDIRNPYFHELYQGITDGLDPSDGALFMVATNDIIERQAAAFDNFVQTGTAGLIVVPASGSHPEDFEQLTTARIPHLLVVRNIGHADIDYIGGNPMLGMMMATEHLVSLGHRRIAFVGGYRSNFAFNERYAGFISTMMKHDVPISEHLVVNGGSTKAFGRKAAADLLQGANPPTAFIGYNDLVAIGIMNSLTEAGLLPGRDVAVMGYDDIPEASEQPVPLTTVATPAYQLGKVVANALGRMKADPGHGPINITFPPTLMRRQSCGGQLIAPLKTAAR